MSGRRPYRRGSNARQQARIRRQVQRGVLQPTPPIFPFYTAVQVLEMEAAQQAKVRQALIDRGTPMVRMIARQLDSVNLTPPFEELLKAGMRGLEEAAAAFDADRGLAFTTFAAPRIRGAMLDLTRRGSGPHG